MGEPEGALGDEKLRLPRLPDEPPPPALAQAVDSTMVENANNNRTNTAKPATTCLLIDYAPP